MYIYIYIYEYTCIYSYIYIHTHTHTATQQHSATQCTKNCPMSDVTLGKKCYYEFKMKFCLWQEFREGVKIIRCLMLFREDGSTPMKRCPLLVIESVNILASLVTRCVCVWVWVCGVCVCVVCVFV